jgi:hypothetical protein
VVVRNADSHVFVPHASHVVTFERCISHNAFENAYWWAPRRAIRRTTQTTLLVE